MLGNFLTLFYHLLDFFQNYFFGKNSFRNTIRVSNSMDADQDGNFVGPDLGPNLLKWLTADEKAAASKERVDADALVSCISNQVKLL